jgi:enoyl-CoA hydratase/carnithine racemase
MISHQPGVGAVPGGTPTARLARLVGRGKALEIDLGAGDIPGYLAAHYGYIDRALPDVDLDIELNLGRNLGRGM